MNNKPEQFKDESKKIKIFLYLKKYSKNKLNWIEFKLVNDGNTNQILLVITITIQLEQLRNSKRLP